MIKVICAIFVFVVIIINISTLLLGKFCISETTGQVSLNPVMLPSPVVGLVCHPALADLLLQLAQIAPRLVILQTKAKHINDALVRTPLIHSLIK